MRNVDRLYYNHIRLALNEHTFLLGGVNASCRYNGNLNQNMNADHPFAWYDVGLRMGHASAKLAPFVRHLFDHMDHAMVRSVVRLTPSLHLLHSNYAAYRRILRAIRTSRSQITIENQYFWSHPAYTNNTVAAELGKRIDRAVQANDDAFRVRLVLNYRNYDETHILQVQMTSAHIGSLYYMRSLVHCDDATFERYVEICMPRDDIAVKCVVHSKVFIVDESFYLFTTANIHDMSFSDRGNMELAIQCTDSSVVTSLTKQTSAYFHAHRHLFRTFHLPSPDVLSTLGAIPRIAGWLCRAARSNEPIDRIDCDTNDVRVMDCVTQRLVNPVYRALLDTSLEQTTGVRLALR